MNPETISSTCLTDSRLSPPGFSQTVTWGREQQELNKQCVQTFFLAQRRETRRKTRTGIDGNNSSRDYLGSLDQKGTLKRAPPRRQHNTISSFARKHLGDGHAVRASTQSPRTSATTRRCFHYHTHSRHPGSLLRSEYKSCSPSKLMRKDVSDYFCCFLVGFSNMWLRNMQQRYFAESWYCSEIHRTEGRFAGALFMFYIIMQRSTRNVKSRTVRPVGLWAAAPG